MVIQINNKRLIIIKILSITLFMSSCMPFQKEIKQENKINYYQKLFIYINDSIKNDYTKIEFFKNMLDTINADSDIFQITRRERIKAQIYDNISNNYLAIHYLDSALTYIDKAINTDSLNFSYYYNKGCIAQDCNLDSLALEYYNTFIEKYKESPSAYYNIALIYYNRRDYDESIENLKLALNYNSKIKPLIYNNLGSAYFQIEKYDEALEAYNKAIDLDSTVVNAYINAGETYLKLNKKEDAMLMFEKVLELKDEHTKSIAEDKIKKISLDESKLDNL